MFKCLLLIGVCATLTGCGTLDKTFDNRLTCTISKDKAYFISLYGPVGISSKINDDDAKTICPKEQVK